MNGMIKIHLQFLDLPWERFYSSPVSCRGREPCFRPCCQWKGCWAPVSCLGWSTLDCLSPPSSRRFAWERCYCFCRCLHRHACPARSRCPDRGWGYWHCREMVFRRWKARLSSTSDRFGRRHCRGWADRCLNRNPSQIPAGWRVVHCYQNRTQAGRTAFHCY